MAKSIGAITLFVADPQRSKEFYVGRVWPGGSSTRTTWRPRSKMDNLLLNLLKTSEAAS